MAESESSNKTPPSLVSPPAQTPYKSDGSLSYFNLPSLSTTSTSSHHLIPHIGRQSYDTSRGSRRYDEEEEASSVDTNMSPSNSLNNNYLSIDFNSLSNASVSVPSDSSSFKSVDNNSEIDLNPNIAETYKNKSISSHLLQSNSSNSQSNSLNSQQSGFNSLTLNSSSTNSGSALNQNILENFNWTNHSSNDSSNPSLNSKQRHSLKVRQSTNSSSTASPALSTVGAERLGRVLTKNQILAYKSFLNDINYTKDQKGYLENESSQLPVISPHDAENDQYADYLSIAPSLIDGYTLISQLTSTFQLPNLIYHAIDDDSGEKVVIRMSPNYMETASISRFLNEWYLLSGFNPPVSHRLYSNSTLANEFIPAEDNVHFDKFSPQLVQPITLPQNLSGVLYPMKILNIDHEVANFPQKRMGLVFPDYDYKTIKDYHSENFDFGSNSNNPFPSNQSAPVYSSNNDTASISSGNTGFGTAPSIRSNSSFNSNINAHPIPGDRLSVIANNVTNSPNVSANAQSAAGTGSFSGAGSGSRNQTYDEFSNRLKQPSKSPLKIVDILSDIISILKTLATIHELGIVHNGITSHSILRSTDVNLALNNIVLTGWDFAFTLQQEDCSNGYRKRHLTDIPELLPYISPEVTGEISSSVDYRSDFYSMGVVLYELILGCLPFQSDNPSKLIRMHLLQKPISPSLIGSGWVSEKLSDVIMKLLEKDPHNRYWDCYTLINDLIKIKNDYVDLSLKANDQISRIEPLAKFLIKETLHFPEKIGLPPTFITPNTIFGRTHVYRDFLKTYESMSQGMSWLMIDGNVGVGKSTVLEDLKSSAISKYDFYVLWKFSGDDQNVSLYSCFLNGMRDIIKQILSSSIENIAKWRDILTSKIKLDLSILFKTIPELKVLLGPKYTSIHQNRRERRNTSENHQDIEDQAGVIDLEKVKDDEIAKNLKKIDLELNEDQKAEVELYYGGSAGVDDQLINLEIKFRYILKAFYGLVCSQGLTVLWDDIQWCSKKEWGMLNEIMEFFKVNELKLSLKFIAVYGYDVNGNFEENTVADIQDIKDSLKRNNIPLYEYTLDPLNKEELSNYIQTCFTFSLAPESDIDKTSMGSMIVKDSVNEIPFIGRHVANDFSNNIKDEEIEALTPNLYEDCGGSVLNLKYLIRGYYLSGELVYVNRVNGNNVFYKLIKTKSLERVNKEDAINFYLTKALSEEARWLLKFAALVYVGDHFTLSDLMIVTKLPMRKIYELLNLCMETKIIVPNSTYYKLPFHIISTSEFPFDITDSLIWELASETRYRFYHGSIQLQLLKEMADDNDLHEYHRLCGLGLYGRIKKQPHTSVSKFLVMATHLLKSLSIAKKDEHETYVEALIDAARYAASTYNLESSLNFFKGAENLIPESDRKGKLKSTLTICQINFYLKNFDECLRMISQAEKKFGFDETMFLITRVRCLFQLKRFKQGLKYAIRGLRKLGVDVHTNPEKCKVISDRLLHRLPLSVPEIRKMKYLPKTTNPKILMIYELISDIIAPSYMCHMDSLRKALVTQMTILMHTYGVSSYCTMGLIEFANIFLDSDTEAGMMKSMELCKLALSLVDNDLGVSSTVSQNVYEVYVASMAAFTEPMSDILRYYTVFLSSSKAAGRVDFSSMSTVLDCSKLHLLFWTGQPYNVMLKQGSYQIIGPDKEGGHKLQWDVFRLAHGSLTLEDYKAKYSKFRNSSRDFEFCYLVGIVYWYCAHGLYDEATKVILEKAYPTLNKLPITIMHFEFYYQCAIALTRNHGTMRQAGFEVAKEIAKKFQLWDEFSPANFHAKNLIIKASLNTINRSVSPLDTLDLYEEAIERAREYNYWHDVAHAHLLCATWLISTNQSNNRAQFHAKNALHLYKRLDAEVMVARINKQCGEFFEDYNWAGVEAIRTNDFPPTPSQGAGPAPLRSILKNFFGDDINEEFPGKLSRRSRLLGSISSSNRTKVHENKTDEVNKHKSADSYEVDTEDDPRENVMNDLTKAIKACLTISECSNNETIVLSLLESTILFSEVDYGVVIINSNNEPTIQAIGSPNNVYKLENEPLSSRTDLCPFSLIIHSLHTGEITSKDEDPVYFDNRFGKDDYYTHNKCFAMICIPLRTQSGIFGAVYLENQMNTSNASLPFFNSRKKDLLDLLCSQAAVSLDKAILYSQMEVAKRAAEDATAEKASFLANMSHEIRTPFNSLLSCSLFLLDTELTRTQREYVETIKSSAMVTLSIIDGILAFSKIEHGSFTLDSAPFSLNECVESAIQLAGEQAAANDIELVYFNRCQFIDTIIGDVTRFRQIIINLVGNSVKFTAQGYIMVESVATQIAENRYQIRVSVRDTGIGIPDDAKSKVFGAFSQVDASSIRVYGGSGLGLAISKKLADIMNGSLTFESKEGEGSTFHFISSAVVNLRKEPEVEFDEEEATKLGFSNKALILDNHSLGKIALKELLESYGLKVAEISTSSEFFDSKEVFTIIFVHHNLLDEFKPISEKLDKNKSRVILIAKFGKSLPADLEKYNIHSVLLSPFHRLKVISLIQQLKKDMKDPTRYSKGIAMEQTGLRDSPKQNSPDSLYIADKYPLRILLAEDNLINIKVALQHLKKLGYNADHAKDGIEVLENCTALLEKNEKYDVILMDIQMPRKDGIAATIELKEKFIQEGKADMLPSIVALTANVAGEDRERSLNCGMVDFISKPILPNELKRVLQNLGEKINGEHD